MPTAPGGGPICPICRKPAQPRAQNPWFPFCSSRCKDVDLARWLNGDYRIPVRQPEEGPGGDGSNGGNGGSPGGAGRPPPGDED